ncbi:glycosyltransferase family 1 protein [Flavobacterium album]|uniref:Glycosyltransferase family 1 protein n=1 Tax=Flavobacterium album TaxID=2175091 RepID=A0A2S1R2F3_9FLAO|nr:glycosyltransferase family 1 protein [Flavobacterium album]AWH86797.1 glycosyltransferase family 1 protein [Flavobacterium album]
MRSVFLESHNMKNRAGGLGTFNYELIKAIAKKPLTDLEICLNLKDPQQAQDEFKDIFKYKKYTSLQRHAFFRIRGKFDVWHSMNQNTKVEPFSAPKKYILTVHDVIFMEQGNEADRQKNVKLFKDKLERADVITYISDFARQQVHTHFRVPQVEEVIIYNGNPVASALNYEGYTPQAPMDKPFFYSLGDFLERKNFMALVKMIEITDGYNLVISGNNDKSYGQEIKDYINQKNLQDRVFLTGKVSEEGKRFYMANCAAFLFPSVNEGFGLPPIEAMYFGKPVFLSNLSSLPEIGGDAAFYWENFDPGYMRDFVLQNLQRYHASPGSYVEKIKARAAFFSWDKAAHAYLELYRK